MYFLPAGRTGERSVPLSLSETACVNRPAGRTARDHGVAVGMDDEIAAAARRPSRSPWPPTCQPAGSPSRKSAKVTNCVRLNSAALAVLLREPLGELLPFGRERLARRRPPDDRHGRAGLRAALLGGQDRDPLLEPSGVEPARQFGGVGAFGSLRLRGPHVAGELAASRRARRREFLPQLGLQLAQASAGRRRSPPARRCSG